MQLLRHVSLSLRASLLRHTTVVNRTCSISVTCWKCAQQLSIPLNNDSDIIKMHFCGCEDNVILQPVTHNYFTLLGW